MEEVHGCALDVGERAVDERGRGDLQQVAQLRLYDLVRDLPHVVLKRCWYNIALIIQVHSSLGMCIFVARLLFLNLSKISTIR